MAEIRRGPTPMMMVDQGRASARAGHANLRSPATIPLGEAVTVLICDVLEFSRQTNAAAIENRASAALVGKSLKRALI